MCSADEVMDDQMAWSDTRALDRIWKLKVNPETHRAVFPSCYIAITTFSKLIFMSTSDAAISTVKLRILC